MSELLNGKLSRSSRSEDEQTEMKNFRHESFLSIDRAGLIGVKLHGLRVVWVAGLARAVLDHPEAICAFNPGGELLLGRPEIDARVETDRRIDAPALDTWSNVRLFSYDDGWSFMDTVG